MRNLHAYNYPLLLTAYVGGTGLIILLATELLLQATGKTAPYPMLILISWCALCFSSVYWWSRWQLLFRHVRRPIREEEMILRAATHELTLRCGDNEYFRILITDSSLMNAYASGKNT